MQIRNEQPPGLDLSCSRRAALGGLLAAVLTPALLTKSAELPVLAQAPGGGTAIPIPRVGHTETMLSNGAVLVAGGNYLGPLSDAQLYNIGSASWTETGSLNIPRTRHAAASMGDGSVLVCGGTYLGIMSDAELYDPSAGTWSTVAPMNIPRFGHSAASINGGVLVYGGEDLGAMEAPEFFDGANWTLL